MSRTQFGGLAPDAGRRAVGGGRVPGVEPPWEMPAFVIRGRQPGPTLAVTGGIHAAEYPGIASATRLAREGDPAALRGTLIVVSPGNSPRVSDRSMYTKPGAWKDINRTIPRDSAGPPPEPAT